MIATIIICALTFIGITLSILFFPHIKIKHIQIDTYWIVALIGATILVATTLCPFEEKIDCGLLSSFDLYWNIWHDKEEEPQLKIRMFISIYKIILFIYFLLFNKYSLSE